jgi:hypothetical protein
MAILDNLVVLADWDRDQTYDHALSNITARVLSMQWTWGFNAPAQLVAPPASGTLVLDNSDGAFNLGKTGAAYAGLLRPGVLIKAYLANNAGPYQLDGIFPVAVLRVLGIAIAPGILGSRTVMLALGDWHGDLMTELYDPPLTLNTTTGAAVQAAFDNAAVRAPYGSSWWTLDASLLDTSTIVYSNTLLSSASGYTTLAYVGDNSDQGQGNNLYAFIQEMCVAEMDGRFFYFPYSDTPVYRFLSRNDLNSAYSITNIAAIPSSSLREDGAEYEYARTLCNQLKVTMYPRRVGSAGTELARTTSPLLIPGMWEPKGNTRTFTLRYRDPDFPDGTCAAIAIVPPVASADYTGNLSSDGTGEDYTGNLIVAVTNKTNAADITVINSALGPVYLTLLKIKGTPLTARQALTLTATDAQSIYDYGMAQQAVTVAGISDQELVQAYADAYVNRTKTPLSRYRVVSFDVTDNQSSPLFKPQFMTCVASGAFTEFVPGPTFVQITDGAIEDTATARVSWIAGQSHTIDGVARTWVSSWYLEDIQQWLAWRLDYTAGLVTYDGLSILDQTTRLAF